MQFREIEVSVVSDLHLATHACKPKKILKYLKSIKPHTLVLNGDIIDSWRFSRNYFPKNHLKVIRQLIKMMEQGVEIFYVTGNHDEFLRKFTKAQIGNLKIVNQVILNLNNQQTWIFHGDIFDDKIHQSKHVAKLGAAIYGLLNLINNSLNHVLRYFGKGEVIIYKSLKKRFVKEKPTPSKFEHTLARSAIDQGYQTVICGHTHIPKEKEITIDKHRVHYFNCGDWVEHFTATEFYNGKWHLYYHQAPDEDVHTDELEFPAERQIFQKLVSELAFTNIL